VGSCKTSGSMNAESLLTTGEMINFSGRALLHGSLLVKHSIHF
jgi:hypothetical protein